MADRAFVASPSVTAYAGRMGVDLAMLAKQSGRTVLAREDIDNHLAGNKVAPNTGRDERYWDVDHSEFGQISEEPMSRLATLSAENLSAANRLIPQVTHHDRADTRAVEAFRNRMKPEVLQRSVRLTALAFHVKVLARCLADFPQFNSSLGVDGKTLIKKHYVHVGIAVDTPQGLVVPVIRDVDRLGLWEIAQNITDIAERARNRKIRSNELGGASMSISNLGGIGGTGFTPVVNPPEVAILGITKTELVPVWEGDAFEPVSMVPLCLSYDHRVINGADAARFLAHYSKLFGDPKQLLMNGL